MRTLYFWILILLLSGGVSGCGENMESMHDDVMVVHDEVMPRMGEMHQLRLALEAKMSGQDSLNSLPYLEAIRSLKQGEDMMWTWMNEYKRPTSASPETIQYLRDQKEIITEVADKMTSAIDQAKTLLP